MVATFVNALAVILGSTLGLLIGTRLGKSFQETVYNGIGVVSIIIGISMALQTQRVLYLALALVSGGLLGTWWGVENGILNLGNWLKKRFASKEGDKDFAYGFLTASVLYCVGALTIVGAFQAGTEGDYQLLLTKSVMDGFMSILLASALGLGVGFSALSILVYQGGLTLLAVWIRPLVTPLLLSEISGVGGAMVVMIGLNLLRVKEIRTGDFIPALLVIIPLVLLDPHLAFLGMGN